MELANWFIVIAAFGGLCAIVLFFLHRWRLRH